MSKYTVAKCCKNKKCEHGYTDLIFQKNNKCKHCGKEMKHFCFGCYNYFSRNKIKFHVSGGLIKGVVQDSQCQKFKGKCIFKYNMLHV
jgi:hypothetical protein